METGHISGLLGERFPAVAAGLADAFPGRVRVIPGTADTWCRDYMPVAAGPGRFVQFRYDPDYLRGDAHLRTVDAGRLIGLDAEQCDLVVDGGNVVRRGGIAVMTDKVYRENSQVSRPQVRERLRAALEVAELVVVPREPYESLGHADGVLQFVADRHLIVNDYAAIDPAYGRRLAAVLARHRLGVTVVPYTPITARPARRALPSAAGVYVNVVEANGTVAVPTFGLPADAAAVAAMTAAFAGRRVVPVPCDDLAPAGGALACVTWVSQTSA